EAAQRPPQLLVRARQLLNGSRVGRIGGGLFQTLVGAIARLNDRLEGVALVLDVTLGGLDQVGNQVVAPREVHIDLREGISEGISRRDQLVVGRYEHQHEPNDQQQ